MSNIKVETVTSIADKAKILMALIIVVGGIVSFSVFETTYSGPIRFAIFVLSLLIAAGIVAISEPEDALLVSRKLRIMKFVKSYGQPAKKLSIWQASFLPLLQ